MINFITNLDPFNKGVLMITTPLVLFYLLMKLSEKVHGTGPDSKNSSSKSK